MSDQTLTEEEMEQALQIFVKNLTAHEVLEVIAAALEKRHPNFIHVCKKINYG